MGYYFSKQEIQYLNEFSKIIGLITDPILTVREEQQSINGFISGETLEQIFNKLGASLPILIYNSGFIGSFFGKKMTETFKMKKQHFVPAISLDSYLITHDEFMFESFANCYQEKLEEVGLKKLDYQKKQNKNCINSKIMYNIL